MESQTLVQQLAAFVGELHLDDLPDEVVAEARRCILDTVGVVVAGQRSPVAVKALAHAQRLYAPGRASIAGSQQRLQPSAAALVNACAGHAYDFDDTSYTGIMHGSVAVLPAALAMAQQQGAAGEALLEAFIAGVEVEYAVAEYCGTGIYFKGWWTTGIYGALGAAAACAKLLQLDAAGTARALSLAVCNASGVKAAFGSDAKPLGVGLVASRGVDCALQAQLGVGAPADAFENSRGFLALYNDGRREQSGELRLGQRWRLIDPGILFKRYPVCSAAQAATELCARLLRDNGLSPQDVEHVACEVPELVRISLVYDRPQTVPEAQFSLPFALGCMLAYGELGLAQLDEATLADADLCAQMEKVSMSVPDWLAEDETAAERCPEGAGVRLLTVDGREYADFLDRPTGMPGNPVSDAALREKCLACLAFADYSGDRSKRLVDRLWNLPELADCGALDL